MEDGNRQGFEDAVKNANLPNFDEKIDEAYNRLHETAQRNVQHTPRQQGPWIICTSCEHAHTIMYVKPPGKMVGINKEGLPIIK